MNDATAIKMTPLSNLIFSSRWMQLPLYLGCRQQAWLGGLWLEYGVDQATLVRKFVISHEEKNSNVYAWYKGKRQANEDSVNAVNKLYPGSRVIFDYPVWKLLGLEQLRPKHIDKLQADVFESNYVPTIPNREIGPERSLGSINPLIDRFPTYRCWLLPALNLDAG